MKVTTCNCIALALGIAIFGFSLHAEPLRYAVKIDLGTGFHAIKLNNLDQILGQQQGVTGIWSPGTGFAALPAPTGEASGFNAVGFNDKGQVIGIVLGADRTPANALMWTSIKAPPATIAQGTPLAINANGQIAIWPDFGPGLIWSNGKTVALPNYKNDRSAFLYPTDINDLGAVAAFGGPLALLVTERATYEIAYPIQPSRFPPDQGLYVNNAGVVAGDSEHFTNGVQISRAFIWTPQSGTIDLGTPGNQSSFVMGLDEHNRVLGYLDRKGGMPFVWQPGVGMTELTSLIDLSGQYVRMQSVADINSHGDILGSLLDKDGVPHIVVLMVVPEPAAWLIGALGMFLGVLFKCRSAVGHIPIASKLTTIAAAVIAGLTLGLCSNAAQATVIEWHLQNLKFVDGAIATGFISVDVDHNGFGPTPDSNPGLVDWGIKISGGSTVSLPDFAYTPASTFESTAHAQGSQGGRLDSDTLTFYVLSLGGTAQTRRVLTLELLPQMTSAGGQVSLSASERLFDTSSNILGSRTAFGTLGAPFPEPSTITLLALGVGALIALSVRRKR
jgi:hypothetical protein